MTTIATLPISSRAGISDLGKLSTRKFRLSNNGLLLSAGEKANLNTAVTIILQDEVECVSTLDPAIWDAELYELLLSWATLRKMEEEEIKAQAKLAAAQRRKVYVQQERHDMDCLASRAHFSGQEPGALKPKLQRVYG